MTLALPYSTIGGQVTINETFAQLLDQLGLARDCLQRMSTPLHTSNDYTVLDIHVTMAEEACNVIGHLYATEDDERSRTLSHGWHGVAEMLHNNRISLRNAAMHRHHNHWAKIIPIYDKIIHHVKLMHEGKLQ